MGFDDSELGNVVPATSLRFDVAISHEIPTPLNGVIGTLDLSKSEANGFNLNSW